jgi:arylsulfatase A-like enzyme
MIGKWHLSYQYQGLRAPNDAGWSHFAGALVGRVDDYFTWERVENGLADPCSRYVTSQQVDDALAWIQGQEKPWLCFLSLVAPHEPLHAPPAELHSQDLSDVPTLQRTYYKAAIEAMDSELGRMFEALGPQVMARTNVIFLGDNGSIQGMAAPPFLRNRAKGTPYEGGLNVPLIIAGPAITDPGREVAELACAVDVFHTALDLAGALDALPSWVQTDGVSLLPCLAETTSAPLREFAFSEEFLGNSWPAPLDAGFTVIRNARYKLIQRVDAQDELFDLLADPWESQNLLRAPLTPAAERNLAELRAEMAAIRANRASVVAFGAPTCSGSNGLVPRIEGYGRPRIGSRYDIGVTDCLGQSPVLHLFGFGAMDWNGLPLPLSLSALGAGSGCAIYIAPDSLSLEWTDTQGAAMHSVMVPNAPGLVGTKVFHQWLALDPAAPGNSLGWVTSDALAAGLGL